MGGSAYIYIENSYFKETNVFSTDIYYLMNLFDNSRHFTFYVIEIVRINCFFRLFTKGYLRHTVFKLSLSKPDNAKTRNKMQTKNTENKQISNTNLAKNGDDLKWPGRSSIFCSTINVTINVLGYSFNNFAFYYRRF